MAERRCALCFVPVAEQGTCPQCSNLPQPPSDVLSPGLVLQDKYRIGKLLGRGGFGATYMGWDLNLQVRVAIKEFLPQQLVTRDPYGSEVSPYSGMADAYANGLSQFLREARILAQFRDEAGIIPVLDFFSGNGTAYMVLKYEDGMTLEQYLVSVGPLPAVTVLQLLAPVATALRACHGVGLIHRDISPDNIFLTQDHRIKLFDFGASRFALNPEGSNLSVILKEGFAPFEQYQRNGRQGPWTDIYALTATLYRLLTGGLPPSAPDRLGGTPLKTLAERGVRSPACLEDLIERGMALQIEQRFQTIDEFMTAANAVLRDLAGLEPAGSTLVLGESMRQEPAPTAANAALTQPRAVPLPADALLTPKPARKLPLFAFAGSGAVVVGTALAFWVWHGMAANMERATDPAALGNPVDDAKADLTQAVQDQLGVQLNLVRLNAAQTALQQMGPSEGDNDPTAPARQMEHDQIDTAKAAISTGLARYYNALRLLAAEPPDAVATASATAQSDAQASVVDDASAAQAAKVSHAITVIGKEVNGLRDRSLTTQTILSDLN